MQSLLNDLRRKEQEMVAMEAVLEQDFANANLEKAYDDAYKNYYHARNTAAERIVSITGDKIDMRTALRMLDQRNTDLTALIEEGKATA